MNTDKWYLLIAKGADNEICLFEIQPNDGLPSYVLIIDPRDP
jgi:hypothetical protein